MAVTLVILFTERRGWLVAFRLSRWLVPVIGPLLIIACCCYLLEWRLDVPPHSSGTYRDLLTYLPLDTDLFRGSSGWPSAEEVNAMVTEFRVGTATYIVAIPVAAWLWIRAIFGRRRSKPEARIWTAWNALAVAGTIEILSYLLFNFVLPNYQNWIVRLLV